MHLLLSVLVVCVTLRKYIPASTLTQPSPSLLIGCGPILHTISANVTHFASLRHF